MWLAERVWEPHLAKPIAEAGVEYVILDDNHFKAAGLPGHFSPHSFRVYVVSRVMWRSVIIVR
jgi:predicted glycosyl hydrolase (DUF1957 family)